MSFAILLRSKTFWGALLAAASIVLAAYPAITAEVLMQAVGILLGGIGIRAAIAKNGNGQ